MLQLQLSITKVLFTASALAIAVPLWHVFLLAVYHPIRSSLRHIPGPKGTSLILGSFEEVIQDEHGKTVRAWVDTYGRTLSFKGIFYTANLLTVDTRAIHHMLTHTDVYQKAPATRKALAMIFGEGLLAVEGAEHRQQRRILNPAFGPTQIRELTGTFFAKANQLRDIWASEIAKDPTTAIAGTRIDAVPWLTKTTLDIIGLAGFNYDFEALSLQETPNELKEAFATLCTLSVGITIFDILRSLIPGLNRIPTAKSRTLEAAQRSMTKIGSQLVSKAKVVAQGEMEASGMQLRGRDLLTLLIKANLATEVPESQKLSDKEVISQVPTFLIAGHETTSSAVSWALFALTQAPGVQRKLREEVLAVDTDTPSMDELNALPYLDAVVRETLRLYPPGIHTTRLAMKDDVLPLEKPYTDRCGVVRNSIPLIKGDSILISVQAINRCKELWGPDANEFKPERWHDLPEGVSKIPGIWGHTMTFLGGPKACIGWRFALVESKAILFSLIRAFAIELAVPASQVGSWTAIVQRPVLRDDPTHQPQLPLLVRTV